MKIYDMFLLSQIYVLIRLFIGILIIVVVGVTSNG